MSLREFVIEKFIEHFNEQPTWIVRAPGRVNLIGEHTDYNDGFVMPLAIDRQILIALRARDDDRIVLRSLDYDDTLDIVPAELDKPGDAGWGEYVKAVAWALQQQGYSLKGWEGVMTGNIPKGAGLSSSAALELAVAKACSVVADIPWSPAEMAKIGQKAENQWVGMQCGIMDQMISAAGQADHALLIDCRSLESTPVPFPAGTAIVVMDTATRRGLVDSAYNERRRQCHEAAQAFGKEVLRDVERETFDAQAEALTDLQRRRARHVIYENERVFKAMQAMQSHDAKTLGELMYASHVSLRDDFEVSSDELNVIVECARQQPACYGARMTGAGFGGCAVALIQADAGESFLQQVAEEYQQQTGIKPNMYLCQATNGTEVL